MQDMCLMHVLKMNKRVILRFLSTTFIRILGYTQQNKELEKPNNTNPVKITRFNSIFALLCFTLKIIYKSTQIPYILIEEHLKRCNLNFVLIKRGPNA